MSVLPFDSSFHGLLLLLWAQGNFCRWLLLLDKNVTLELNFVKMVMKSTACEREQLLECLLTCNITRGDTLPSYKHIKAAACVCTGHGSCGAVHSGVSEPWGRGGREHSSGCQRWCWCWCFYQGYACVSQHSSGALQCLRQNVIPGSRKQLGFTSECTGEVTCLSRLSPVLVLQCQLTQPGVPHCVGNKKGRIPLQEWNGTDVLSFSFVSYSSND